MTLHNMYYLVFNGTSQFPPSYLPSFVFRSGWIVVPGDAFGASGAGFVRASYATAYEKLEDALNRIGRHLFRDEQVAIYCFERGRHFSLERNREPGGQYPQGSPQINQRTSGCLQSLQMLGQILCDRLLRLGRRRRLRA